MNIIATLRFCANLLVLALFTGTSLAAEVVPVVKTKTETFSNVTLVSRTPTHLFIQHSRGMATIKIAGLDTETLSQFGIVSSGGADANAPDTQPKKSAVGATTAAASARCTEMLQNLKNSLPPDVSAIMMKFWLGALGLFLGFYLFNCYCAKLICQKSGAEPGILVWLPVLQTFPLLRAAGMSGWWFLGFFVPVLNVVAALVWCLNIAKVRGKGVFTAIMLFLPPTGLFAFLYLAFSGGGRSADDEVGPSVRAIKLEPLPA